jgi:hypothetical protein
LASSRKEIGHGLTRIKHDKNAEKTLRVHPWLVKAKPLTKATEPRKRRIGSSVVFRRVADLRLWLREKIEANPRLYLIRLKPGLWLR